MENCACSVTRGSGHVLLNLRSFPVLIPVLDTIDTQSQTTWYRIEMETSGITHHYAFYYAPRPLIDRAPRNNVTSLTTYTTHTCVGDTRT